MNRNFDTYNFSIIDKKFDISEELYIEQTAILELISDNKIVEKLELGYFSGNEIIDFAIKNNALKLNNCLLDNFPELEGDFPEVKLIECFIINPIKIEFSCRFPSPTNFSKSFFVSPEVDFSACHFKGSANFTDTFLKTEKVNFSYCRFNNGLSFKNALFTESIKDFEHIILETGEINFTNVDFGGGNITFQDSKFSEDRVLFTLTNFGDGFVDFTRVKFNGNDVFFERTNFGKGNSSFRSADFGNGTVDFRRSEFGEGEHNFMHTNFGNGNIKFVSSVFDHGKITFRLAEFGNGDIDFHYSKFGNTDIFFERTKFNNGSLDFRGVELLKGKINFNHIEFGDGDFIFEGLEQAKGAFYLKNSVFGRGFINFEEARCKSVKFIIENVDFGYGSVSFRNSEFKDIILQGSQINSYFDFRVKSCEILDLSNTVIKDVLDLSPTDSGLNITTLYMQGVRLLGRIYLDWDRSSVKDLILRQEVSSYEKSEQFRVLKENYRNMGLYEYEDLAYVEFKRMQAKAKLETIKDQKFLKKIKALMLHWFELLIFDKMGHYATNPIRVLYSMGIVYLIFSFIFLFLEFLFPNNALILSSLFSPDSPEVMSNIAKAFYHSAITFLTIGYGDYYPVGAIRVLSAVEGFFGLFLMSYFTVAFVRKILR
ncbi:MAG: two pore domain potassium channel family protein [Bacteroidales bacterium]|nr:two pore domain potassium channel family protein [Bacteroidales bacterium]